MKDIYIVLIKAHTGLGSIARRLTGYPYTHIAVSLDRSMTDFISYSRRYHYFPFDAGYTHEYRDYYAFGSYERFGAKVFRLRLSEEGYAEVMDFIRNCENDKAQLFNIFSMATMPVIGGFRIYRANNCMSFTARVIEKSGCVRLEKPFYRYSIKDMDLLLGKFAVFEGSIRKRRQDSHGDYMRSFGPLKFFSDMAKLVFPLTFRLIFRRPENMD